MSFDKAGSKFYQNLESRAATDVLTQFAKVALLHVGVVLVAWRLGLCH
jgi:hypothetical protein